ncbi:LysR family transcriptional regulator [Deferribacter autotrophicus]|uniref:LysR family transcriptional regulator n=1 Tax=Deferribacter autotrophicus TaxID=500465 RepID=A0A5A8F3Y0_9BACT|nr:LysR family transcriptional regulator [Deferribacter autotrophicus]KAA0258171.1 LysR family transcriptional regulator [Deferribacter autotrophicus]
MNITLRQLEVFITIIKTGNITKAAEELNMTQAAASMALKELENQLGEQLFERVGKKLYLNENGRHLKGYALEIIEKSYELSRIFKSGKVVGELRVGASSTIGNYILPAYISEFIVKNKNVKIMLEVGNTEEILNKILSFDVDFGFVEGFSTHTDLKMIEWIEDELAVFVNINNQLAKRDVISVNELKECEWILRERGSGTREVFEYAMSRSNIPVNVLLELGHTEAIKNAVSQGVGVGCLSKAVLEDLVRLKKIKILNVPFLDLKRKFYFVMHKKKYITTVIKKFMDYLNLH